MFKMYWQTWTKQSCLVNGQYFQVLWNCWYYTIIFHDTKIIKVKTVAKIHYTIKNVDLHPKNLVQPLPLYHRVSYHHIIPWYDSKYTDLLPILIFELYHTGILLELFQIFFVCQKPSCNITMTLEHLSKRHCFY